MNRDEFAARAAALSQPLYYVSCTILHVPADREDALQSCLEKGLRKCGSLRDADRFRPWITRILVNECHDILRKKKRMVLSEEVLPDQAAVDEIEYALRDAVMSLPDRLRTPFVMQLEGYTVRETASILRIPEGTVKHRLRGARLALRAVIDESKEVLA